MSGTPRALGERRPREGSSANPASRLPLHLLALFAALLAVVALDGAVRWYGHPFASVLVSPDGDVSGIGSPSWEGLRRGLRFPDLIVSVDGRRAIFGPHETPATALDEAVVDAARAQRPTVHVVVDTAAGPRELDLPVVRLGAAEWWLLGGVLFLAAGAYVLAGLTALVASPRGPLARTFAKTAFIGAAFLLTLFDLQTSRRLTLVWECAFATLPLSFLTLALRLPDDVPLLRRFPAIPRVFDFVGITLAAAMVVLDFSHAPTLPIRSICTILFGTSQVAFVVIFVVRYLLSRGERRLVLRALVAAVAPVHLLLAVGILLPMLSARGSAATFFVLLPVLSLTPFSAVVAFIRHDLWGSRALLSRVLTLTLVGVVACVVATAAGGALAASFGISFGPALLAAGAGAVASAGLVSLAVRFADRGFFPAHAEFKPTVNALSEHLASINDPGEAARAVERTVRGWLDSPQVRCVPRDPDDTPIEALLELDGGELTLPITFRGEMIGVLHVGRKPGGALFTSDDLDLLRTIVNQAALALAHAKSYRELEERRRKQAEAWRGERTALVETVAAEIAHEIRYPINYFRSVFQRGTREGAEVRLDAEDVEIGQEEVDRLERLVAGLRRVASHRLERRVVLVADLAARAEVLLRDRLGARTIECAIPEGVALRCDLDQATQVVVNLLSNALDAARPTGRVGLAWRALDAGGDLVVWDNGPGFEGEASRLFAPWFTTKPRGTGLGLAITQRIVGAHGWSIDARRVDGKTQFLVHVPASDVTDEDGELVASSEPLPAEPLRH